MPGAGSVGGTATVRGGSPRAEALARLGERAGVLASRNDGFYHWDDELACGQSVRVLDEATHEDLIRQAAPGWVSEMLQTTPQHWNRQEVRRMLTRLDLWLFGTINGLAGRVGWLDALGRLLVNDYLLPSALALMLLWLWLSGRTDGAAALHRAVVNAFVAQFIANLILKLINLSYFRPRPSIRIRR